MLKQHSPIWLELSVQTDNKQNKRYPLKHIAHTGGSVKYLRLLFYPFSFASFCASRSCLGPTRSGTTACATAAPSWPSRSTLIEPLGSMRATGWRHRRETKIKNWISIQFWHQNTWIVRFVSLSFLLLESVSVIVTRVPCRIHQLMSLSLLASFLVILGLFLAIKTVPLEME